jgi:hypothetical protein
MSLVLLMMGCQSLAERQQTTQLQDILRNYEGVIRWGTIDQIRPFYRSEDSEGMLNNPVAKMRVTHYEVVQGPTVIEENRAIQTAVIQYVFVESQVVRELVDQQVWEYEAEDERWYLISPSPDFK